MAARLILDDPPALTPAELRDFPYRVRPFPFDVLIPARAGEGADLPEPAVAGAFE